MGLCSSKRPARKGKEPFNPISSSDSQKSYVSNSSTKPLTRPNGEETYVNNKGENDLDEFEVEHFLLKNVWDETLFSSPIEKNLKAGNLRVLDVVCGPGHWIYLMASEFSQSKFTGIHASPTCRKLQGPPLNANVVRIDILGDKSYDDDSFDYVHMRVLSPKFTDYQWKQIVFQMTRLTKPGGYCEIEVGDYEGSENEGPIMKMIDARRRCLEESGIKTNVLNDLENIMNDTRWFSPVQKQSRSIPIGKSMGKYGEMASKHFKRIMSSQSKHISSYLGQAQEDFNNDMSEATTEMDQYRSTCLNSVRVFGRKVMSK